MNGQENLDYIMVNGKQYDGKNSEDIKILIKKNVSFRDYLYNCCNTSRNLDCVKLILDSFDYRFLLNPTYNPIQHDITFHFHHMKTIEFLKLFCEYNCVQAYVSNSYTQQSINGDAGSLPAKLLIFLLEHDFFGCYFGFDVFQHIPQNLESTDKIVCLIENGYQPSEEYMKNFMGQIKNNHKTSYPVVFQKIRNANPITSFRKELYLLKQTISEKDKQIDELKEIVDILNGKKENNPEEIISPKEKTPEIETAKLDMIIKLITAN